VIASSLFVRVCSLSEVVGCKRELLLPEKEQVKAKHNRVGNNWARLVKKKKQ